MAATACPGSARRHVPRRRRARSRPPRRPSSARTCGSHRRLSGRSASVGFDGVGSHALCLGRAFRDTALIGRRVRAHQDTPPRRFRPRCRCLAERYCSVLARLAKVGRELARRRLYHGLRCPAGQLAGAGAPRPYARPRRYGFRPGYNCDAADDDKRRRFRCLEGARLVVCRRLWQ